MSTDKMREQFDKWADDKDFSLISKHLAWLAYQAGQRDLIASCGEPVAYQVISHNGWDDRLYPTKDAPPGLAEFLETERRVGNTVRALYSLPEGVQK